MKIATAITGIATAITGIATAITGIAGIVALSHGELLLASIALTSSMLFWLKSE